MNQYKHLYKINYLDNAQEFISTNPSMEEVKKYQNKPTHLLADDFFDAVDKARSLNKDHVKVVDVQLETGWIKL